MNIKAFQYNKIEGSSLREAVLDISRQALLKAKIAIDQTNAEYFGIFMGTTYSNFHIRDENISGYLDRGQRGPSPAEFPRTLLSYLGGYLSIELGIRGVHSTLSSAAASGTDAFAHALNFLERNSKNKAIVIELDEKLEEGPRCLIQGAACLLLSHNEQVFGGSAARFLAFESFFESKGEKKGLKKATEKALAACGLRGDDVRHFLSSEGATPPLAALAGFLELPVPVKEAGRPGEKLVLAHRGEDANSSCLVLELLN